MKKERKTTIPMGFTPSQVIALDELEAKTGKSRAEHIRIAFDDYLVKLNQKD